LRETQELLDLVRAKKIGPHSGDADALAKANEALIDLQKKGRAGRPRGADAMEHRLIRHGRQKREARLRAGCPGHHVFATSRK